MSSITVNGCWQWLCMGSSVIQDSCQHTPVSFQPNEELPDSVCWTLHPSGTFSTRTAWEALQVKAHLVLLSTKSFGVLITYAGGL